MAKRLITHKLILTLGLAGLLFVCSNLQGVGQNPKMNSGSSGQTSVKGGDPSSDMPEVPFNVMVIRHVVADYGRWKQNFDSDSTNRISAGIHLIPPVSRNIENPNEVNLPFMIEDVQKAKSFVESKRLKDVMQKGGVTSQSDILFIKVIRMTDALNTPCDYEEIVHKVKDFDTWLKVFDSEGTAARAKDGLVDGVLARGIDDPNLVYLIFKITDLSKAKSALNNPDRQKIMQESGVIGKPEIFYGRDER
jgi:hypothetical protein